MREKIVEATLLRAGQPVEFGDGNSGIVSEEALIRMEKSGFMLPGFIAVSGLEKMWLERDMEGVLILKCKARLDMDKRQTLLKPQAMHSEKGEFLGISFSQRDN